MSQIKIYGRKSEIFCNGDTSRQEIEGHHIQFANSEAAFDYIWSNGHKISEIVFDDVSDCAQEFYGTAVNWPEITFVISGFDASEGSALDKAS